MLQQKKTEKLTHYKTQWCKNKYNYLTFTNLLLVMIVKGYILIFLFIDVWNLSDFAESTLIMFIT